MRITISEKVVVQFLYKHFKIATLLPTKLYLKKRSEVSKSNGSGQETAKRRKELHKWKNTGHGTSQGFSCPTHGNSPFFRADTRADRMGGGCRIIKLNRT